MRKQKTRKEEVRESPIGQMLTAILGPGWIAAEEDRWLARVHAGRTRGGGAGAMQSDIPFVFFRISDSYDKQEHPNAF